jgi:PAS domain S-box-containing protein
MVVSATQEEVFRAREALLLVESVLDYAIFRLDPAGLVASWNPGAERLKGYRADEIVGQHFSRFYPPADIESGKCERELSIAAREGRVEDEGWRVRKDGSRFWASVVISAIRDARGELLGFAKVTRDLTARRKAEDERVRLAEAEEANRLKDQIIQREQQAYAAVEEARGALMTTLQSIGDAVIATDTRGNVTLMNPVAERLTGWKAADARGRPLRIVFRIVDESTRLVVESPVDRVLREGIVVGLANHALLISRDGVEIPVNDSGAPIRDAAGNVSGVVLVFHDASGESQRNARRDVLADAMGILSSSLDYHLTLSRLAQLAVPRLADGCMIDVLEEGDGLVLIGAAHANQHVLQLVRDLRKRYPPAPSAPWGVGNVLRTGRPELHACVTDEMLGHLAVDDDHLRMLQAIKLRSLVTVPLYAGATPRVLGAASLIFSGSGRRYSSDDLAFAEELARRAASAIENARLYAREQRARDLSDAASRAKDEFLASVSHELRTPLSAILGWARMLSTPMVDERKRARAVETIERNAVGMARLIEDLLDVSRISSGKLRLDLASVELAPIIEAAIESVLPAASAKPLQIEPQLDVDVGLVKGDAGRLDQVVRNLLNNAVKFTPAGGHVKVSLSRRGGLVEIAVKDSGKGIDAGLLTHVFEPFRQGDRSAGGLGLGLAIVKELVALHGGSVHAESEGPGRGSTFTVRLPALVDPAKPELDQPDHRAAKMPTLDVLPQLDGLRVLVVEDEVDMRELVGELLSECGARVATAGTVAEAMEVFEHGEVPEVLISDINMPGETGYDLIRRVRALAPDKGGKIPAAALTAYTSATDRRRVLNAGFELHIPKPVEPIDLVTLVATLARFAGR